MVLRLLAMLVVLLCQVTWWALVAFAVGIWVLILATIRLVRWLLQQRTTRASNR